MTTSWGQGIVSRLLILAGTALAAVMITAPPIHADCSAAFVPIGFGGRGGGGLFLADPAASAPETVVALSRPAPAPLDAASVDFSYESPEPSFSIRFLVIRPSGTRYTVVARTADQHFTAPTPISAYTATLSEPLHFEAGDLLGAISHLTGTGGLMAGYADDPGGYAAVRTGVDVGGSVDRDSFDVRRDSRFSIAMEAIAPGVCPATLPAFAVIVPVGDVIGNASTHFQSDLGLLNYFGGEAGPIPVSATLRDRMGTPGGVNVVQKDLPGMTVNSVFHSDSVSSLLGVPPPFFGTLTIGFPAPGGFPISAGLGNNDAGVIMTSTISAATSACSGGETGAMLPGVGCRGIGKRIQLPFHLRPNHRLHVGVASAFLPACGATHPATSITVRLLQPTVGPEIHVSMSGESLQLNNITDPGSAIPGAVGLTDGVIEVRVTDESTRIIAYVVSVDNTAQDSSPSYGLIVE